eukprot:356093-Chlamydomonas_euryale.AAC.7
MVGALHWAHALKEVLRLLLFYGLACKIKAGRMKLFLPHKGVQQLPRARASALRPLLPRELQTICSPPLTAYR